MTTPSRPVTGQPDVPLQGEQMAKFVVYTSYDEIIVTTEEDEAQLFESYPDRDFENEYDRSVHHDIAVGVQARLRLDAFIRNG
jgi:hypothetical protein